jgi:hypothetical protein
MRVYPVNPVPEPPVIEETAKSETKDEEEKVSS